MAPVLFYGVPFDWKILDKDPKLIKWFHDYDYYPSRSDSKLVLTYQQNHNEENDNGDFGQFFGIVKPLEKIGITDATGPVTEMDLHYFPWKLNDQDESLLVGVSILLNKHRGWIIIDDKHIPKKPSYQNNDRVKLYGVMMNKLIKSVYFTYKDNHYVYNGPDTSQLVLTEDDFGLQYFGIIPEDNPQGLQKMDQDILMTCLDPGDRLATWSVKKDKIPSKLKEQIIDLSGLNNSLIQHYLRCPSYKLPMIVKCDRDLRQFIDGFKVEHLFDDIYCVKSL